MKVRINIIPNKNETCGIDTKKIDFGMYMLHDG